jgi:hypothetical protein
MQQLVCILAFNKRPLGTPSKKTHLPCVGYNFEGKLIFGGAENAFVFRKPDLLTALGIIVPFLRKVEFDIHWNCKPVLGKDTENRTSGHYRPCRAVQAIPEQLIPKSNASEGLWAHIIVSKFADGLPLYRKKSLDALASNCPG